MRSDDNVITVDDQIANRSRRKVLLQRLPVIAVIELDVHGPLRSREEHAFALGIFTHCVYRFIVR